MPDIEIMSGIALAIITAVVGFALGRRQRPGSSAVVVEPTEDRVLDQQIQYAAREWAASHGRPELAGLLAQKVRLLWDIQNGRRDDGARVRPR